MLRAAPFFLLLVFLFLASVPAMAEDDPTAKSADTTQTVTQSSDPAKLFEPREYVGQTGNVLRYRLLKPMNYDPDKRYPLVVFLHGAGERGDDNTAQLKHGMADFCKPERREAYPCYVLAPQCPTEMRWADVDWTKSTVELPAKVSDNLQLVFDVIDSMLEDAAVDKNRIYVTGLSMGGYGTWDAIVRRPDFFAAAMPICGGGDPATAESIKHIPIACFHGEADEVVVPAKSRAIIEAIKSAGGSPQYTEYPGVGHDSWTQTYSNDENFKWLFQQRKAPTSAADPTDDASE